MLYFDRYCNPYHTININPESPSWHHPSNTCKRSDALLAPDNPFSEHSCLKKPHDAFLHCATSQPHSVLGHEKLCHELLHGHLTIPFYNALQHCTVPYSENLTAQKFAQDMSDLVSSCRKLTSYDSQQIS